MKPTNNGYKIVIVLLLIVVVVLSIKLYKSTLNENNQIIEENSVNQNSVLESSSVTESSYLSDDIISLVKKEYKNKNLLKENNIEFWNITSLKKVGYFEDGTNVYYLAGSFKCKDNSSDCVYMSQVDDTSTTIPFSIYVKENNKTIELGLSYFECLMSEETIKSSGDEEYCSKFHIEN